MEQSEEKLCRLREELVVTKEALNASQLRKDMTEREKDELGKRRLPLLLLLLLVFLLFIT